MGRLTRLLRKCRAKPSGTCLADVSDPIALSHMDGALVDGQRRFLHGLGERGMRVAGARKIFSGAAEFHDHGCFRDDLTGVGANMDTPRMRSVVASARTFTKPSVVLLTFARPFAVKGNLPAL